MEFIVEKIGMSRTIGAKSEAVTLLRVLGAKVCEIYDNGKALVAYSQGKVNNRAIAGQQKKYNLSKEFNRFATLKVSNKELGELDTSNLGEAKRVQVRFKTKGRGFSGAMKRWNFQGGPGAHGSMTSRCSSRSRITLIRHSLPQSRKIRKYPVGISRCSPAMLWISRLLKTGRNIWRMGSIFAVPR